MIVIKIGGSILEKIINENALPEILKEIDDDIIIVHGGGNYLNKYADNFGYEQKFVTSPGGIKSRYTDKNTLEIFTMVMSLINQKIVHSLKQAGIKAVALNGESFISARRKDKLVILNEKNRKMVIDGGYTGKINNIDVEPVNALLNKGYIPVVSPIAYSEESYLNVDADRAAAYISGYLHARMLILMTNVNGLYMEDKIVNEADSEYIRNVINKVGHGMDKKLLAATEAIDMGVQKVIISNPFNDIMSGTTIYKKAEVSKNY